MPSSKTPRVYCAGPGVFKLDYVEKREILRKLLEEHGVEAVFPADPEGKSDQEIFEENVRRVRMCQGVLAEVSAFRSAVEPDSGTCFESGMAYALNKALVYYIPEEENEPYLDKVQKALGAREVSPGVWVDNAYGCLVEDFGAPLNLMLTHSGLVVAGLRQAAGCIAHQLRQQTAV